MIWQPYIVLFLQVDPAPVLADPKFFLLGHLPYFSVVLLVPDGCGGRKKEGS